MDQTVAEAAVTTRPVAIIHNERGSPTLCCAFDQRFDRDASFRAIVGAATTRIAGAGR